MNLNKIEIIDTKNPEINRMLIRFFSPQLKNLLNGYIIKKAFIYKKCLYIITKDNQAKKIYLTKDKNNLKYEDIQHNLWKNLIINNIRSRDTKILIEVIGNLKDILALNVPIYINDIFDDILLDITNSPLLKEIKQISIDINKSYLRIRLSNEEIEIFKKLDFYCVDRLLYYKQYLANIYKKYIKIGGIQVNRKNIEENLKKTIIKLSI